MARHETRAERASRSWRPSPRIVLGVILVALAGVFIAQNRGQTQIQVLFLPVSMPLWAALTATLVVGALVGLLGAWHSRG